jgi:type 1 glutamine amidotransferase
MKKIISIWPKLLIIPAVLLITSALFNACQQQQKNKVLIVTGQSTFNWEESSNALKQILENSGLFKVLIHISPQQGEDMSGFNPDFSDYDVVLLNYKGDSWSEKTKTSFVDYVKSGGGVVVYNTATGAFPDWEEYNKIIGLGDWGRLEKKSDLYLYWEEDSFVYDINPGPAGFTGTPNEFPVTNRNTEHPITSGLPKQWKHAKDKLYDRLKGPAENITVLATAYSDTANGGTGRNEPVIFTVKYGEGKVFHTVLGFIGEGDEMPALECVGFITTLLRGTEWAATGQVTQPVPVDFPNSVSIHRWLNFRPLTLDEIMERISGYEIGKSRKYLYDLSNRIKKSDGSTETLMKYEKKMLELLNSEATVDSKNFVCTELSWMGSEKSIPALENLTEEEATAEMAAYALKRLKAE